MMYKAGRIKGPGLTWGGGEGPKALGKFGQIWAGGSWGRGGAKGLGLIWARGPWGRGGWRPWANLGQRPLGKGAKGLGLIWARGPWGRGGWRPWANLGRRPGGPVISSAEGRSSHRLVHLSCGNMSMYHLARLAVSFEIVYALHLRYAAGHGKVVIGWTTPTRIQWFTVSENIVIPYQDGHSKRPHVPLWWLTKVTQEFGSHPWNWEPFRQINTHAEHWFGQGRIAKVREQSTAIVGN